MKSDRGILAIGGLARSLGGISSLLGSCLAIPCTPFQPSVGGEGLWYTLPNAQIVVLSVPGELMDFRSPLIAREGAWWRTLVVGVGQTACDLERDLFAPHCEPRLALSGIRGGGSVSEPLSTWQLSVDHVAYAVEDLRDAPSAVGSAQAMSGWLAEWEFPELGCVSRMMPGSGMYLEFNSPYRGDSYFAEPAISGFGLPQFVCLRVPDIEESRARVRACGFRITRPTSVLARPRGMSRAPYEVARTAVIAPEDTSGLRMMLVQGDWPWRGRGGGYRDE